MRVLFRLSVLGFGGTERVFLSVASYLISAHGAEVAFALDRVDGSETEEAATALGCKLFNLSAKRTISSILGLSTLLRNYRPHVVISAYTETNAAALLSNYISGKVTKVLVSEHASLDDHWRNKSPVRRALLEAIVRFAYPFADKVFCVSRGMSGQLKFRLRGQDVPYIHNPVRFRSQDRLSQQEARSLLNIDINERVVLAVGRVSRQKNYTYLVSAFSRVLTPDAILYIVGGVYEQDEFSRLVSLIDSFGLRERVRFIEFTHDVALFYQAADAFVLSSAWEGFGNVLVEALSFGLPVVSTRCPYGPEEILNDGDFGRLVDLDDPSGFARAIDSALNEERDVSLLLARAAEFSEAEVGEKYVRLIEQAVKGE